MRKLRIMLALILCVSLFGQIPALAAEADLKVEATVTAGADGGDTVLDVTTPVKTNAGEITVAYDESALTFVSAETAGEMSGVKAENGVARLEFSSITAVTGRIAGFVFQSTGSARQTDVTVTAKMFDTDGKAVEETRELTITLRSKGGSTGGGGGGYIAPSNPSTPPEQTEPEPSEPTQPEKSPADQFVDLDKDAWYYNTVVRAIEEELMNGTTDTTFEPNSRTTRAMFVTVLGRAAGVDKSKYTAVSFGDVEAGSWYATYVEWARENNITDGTTDTTFEPNKEITRQEMVTFLCRLAASQGVDTAAEAAGSLDDFTDAGDVDSWARTSFLWAVGSGVVNGKGTSLDPRGLATRAEIAQVVVKYIDK